MVGVSYNRAACGAQAAAAPPPTNRSTPIQDGGGNMKLIGDLNPESLAMIPLPGICSH